MCKTVKKISFLNNVGLFLSAREKILNNFRSKLFPLKNTTREEAPEQAFEPTPEPASAPEAAPAPKPAPEPTTRRHPRQDIQIKIT